MKMPIRFSRPAALCCLLAVSFSVPSHGGGTAGPGLELSRDQAVAHALENSPLLGAARERAQAAAARRLQAGGFEPPSFSWDFDEARGDRPREYGNQVLAIEQSVEWPGLRAARKRAADWGLRAAQAGLDRMRLRLTARVKKAFDQALLAEQVVALLGDMEGFMAEAVALSRVRMKSGTGAYVDLLRTRIARQRLAAELEDARSAARAARRRLAVLLGLEADGVRLRGELDAPALAAAADGLLARAEAEGPTFRLIERRAAQAEQAYLAVRRGRWPQFDLGLGRQRLYDAGRSDYAWAGRIALKFPLPGSDWQRGREGEARARLRELEQQLRALRLRARARLVQRLDEARVLAGQVARYRQDILPDVEDQRQAAQLDYRVRRIDALNLLDVYTTYRETRRSYLEAVTRYRAALADLETLGEDLWEIEE